MTDLAVDSRRLELLYRWLGLSMLLLMAVTWRLWWVAHDMPTLPALSILTRVPIVVDRFAFVVAVAALVCLTVRARGIRMLAIALAVLLALDQLRWQAWAWHALLICGILLGPRTRWRIVAIRTLMISIYAYSAVAKCDHAFVTTLGQQFLSATVGLVGLDTLAWTAPLRNAIALCFPLTELLTAALLALPRTRKFGVIVALLLHVGLAVLLSPLGLGHSLGVVLWNILFAGMTWILFSPPNWLPKLTDSAATREADNRRGYILPLAVATLLGVFAPALGLLGWWDPWPSWALYAPGRERATMLVTQDAEKLLPESLQGHCHAAPDWREVDLDAWCLAETGAPLYPGTRVPCAIAYSIATRHGIITGLRVVQQSAADRISGERTSHVFSTTSQLGKSLDKYWISTGTR